MATTPRDAEPDEARDDHDDLGRQMAEVLLSIHSAYAGSQVTSGSKRQRVYGQIFDDLSDRLCTGLQEDHGRNDVDVRKLGHAGYHVPVIAGTLYFPWRPRGGGKPEDVRFGGSTTREGLWRVRRETDTLPLFPGPGEDLILDQPADADTTGSLATLMASQEHLPVVIVAMTSTSHQVDRIEWGPARINGDGMLVWEPELLWDATTRSTPVSTNTTSFDAGLAPRPTVSPKVRPEEEGGAASGNTSDV